MNILSLFFETAATAAESALVFLSVRRLSGNKKCRSYIVPVGVLCLTLLVIILNKYSTFSFITPLSSMIFVTLFLGLSLKEPALKVCAATVLVYLVLNTIDYSLFFAFGIFVRKPVVNTESFYYLMSPGPVRYSFLTADKAVQAALYFGLRKLMVNFSELKKRYMVIVFGISVVSYFAMSYLVSMILSDSVAVTQAGILLSWVFSCSCVIVSLAALVFFGRYQEENQSNHLLKMSNSLMEQNYDMLHRTQERFSKMNHDFMSHLRFINQLAEQGDIQEIKRYSAELLCETGTHLSACKSGNDAVDAVINAKIDEAKRNDICFSWHIESLTLLQISPVDICAVLSNQIDNAFDACKLIQNPNNKKVEVHIWNPTESVVVFQVKNTTSGDPLKDNGKLVSTKADKTRVHGIGIRSIRESAEKYGGTLENTYQDGWFTSTVSMLSQSG